MNKKIEDKLKQAEEQSVLWQRNLSAAKEQVIRWEAVTQVCRELLAEDGEAEEQESEEWRTKYRRRAGIEGVNRGLDRRTGIKELRVRGMRAVAHAVYGKVMGWNIVQGARALRKRALAARKALRAAVGTLIKRVVMRLAVLVEFMLWSSREIETVTNRRHSRQPRWNPTPA